MLCKAGHIDSKNHYQPFHATSVGIAGRKFKLPYRAKQKGAELHHGAIGYMKMQDQQKPRLLRGLPEKYPAVLMP